MLLSGFGDSLGVLLKSLLLVDQVVQEIAKQLEVLLRMRIATSGGKGVIYAAQLSFVLKGGEQRSL